jgi:adenine phosphoribosyltransferase
MKTIKDYVRTIPDFPEKGIMFRDITTVIQDPEGFRLAIDTMQELIKDMEFDAIAGAEARGFVFGSPIAYNLNKPLVLIRKKGKLPGETVSIDYTLEYGSVTTLEMHKDAVKPGDKILLLDDLLATGGTINAMAQLVEKQGAEVAGILVLLELAGLKGRDLLKKYKVYSAVSYEGK